MIDQSVFSYYRKELEKQIDIVKLYISTSCQTSSGLARLKSELHTLEEALKYNERLEMFYNSSRFNPTDINKNVSEQNAVFNSKIEDAVKSLNPDLMKSGTFPPTNKISRNYDPNLFIGSITSASVIGTPK